MMNSAMSTIADGARQHWHAVHTLLERWLEERQELIILMCDLSSQEGLVAYDMPSSARIQRFCQVLMDYISAGHFEVYQRLQQEAEEFRDEASMAARALYPRIESTTSAALRFNDLYDTDEHCEELIGNLRQELSELGELLEERFQMEDRLIDVLHNRHRALVA